MLPLYNVTTRDNLLSCYPKGIIKIQVESIVTGYKGLKTRNISKSQESAAETKAVSVLTSWEHLEGGRKRLVVILRGLWEG